MAKIKYQCRLPVPIWEAIDALQELTPVLSKSAVVSFCLWSFDLDSKARLPADITALNWRDGRNIGFLIPAELWVRIDEKHGKHRKHGERTIPETVALAILTQAKHPRRTVPAEFLAVLSLGRGKKRGRPPKK